MRVSIAEVARGSVALVVGGVLLDRKKLKDLKPMGLESNFVPGAGPAKGIPLTRAGATTAGVGWI